MVDEATELYKRLEGQGIVGDIELSKSAQALIKEGTAKIASSMAVMISTAIASGIKRVEQISEQKVIDLIHKYLGDDIELNDILKHRAVAVNTLHDHRKAGRHRFSERVWRVKGRTKELSTQIQTEMNTVIDTALLNGTPAEEFAKDLKRYLKEPNKRFRRTRDEDGRLRLSKKAQEYHPGRGVYRSSYKNARRLSATEVNIAYRKADNKRWQSLPMVVGIKIELSNNHTCLDSKGVPRPFTDICDDLAGDYPKEFEFTGWHPHCRCIATPILKTPEELKGERQRIREGKAPLEGSTNEVKDLPNKFYQWQSKNAERIRRAAERGTLPYFIRDNFRVRPRGRVDYMPARRKDIKKRWAERNAKKAKQ